MIKIMKKNIFVLKSITPLLSAMKPKHCYVGADDKHKFNYYGRWKKGLEDLLGKKNARIWKQSNTIDFSTLFALLRGDLHDVDVHKTQ